MSFTLTAEQRELATSIRALLAHELRPIVDGCERQEEFPVGILSKLGAFDMLGLSFLPPLGTGGGHVEVVVLAEELAAIAGGVCSGVMTHCIGAKLIDNFGSESQRERYLPRALQGQLVCAIAISEPDHGSDVASIETRATHSDGGWLLNGHKMYITNGSHADVFMVMCRTNPAAGKSGLSMLLVDGSTDGVQVGRPLKKLGWHSSDTTPVHFDDCFVPQGNVLGEEGHGFAQLMQGFVFERVVMAAMAVGTARCALEDALEFAKERRQFDRRIAEFQAVRHKLANMACDVQAARQLTYWAASEIDERPGDGGPAAMAKLFSSEVASRVASDAVQIFGGMGFMAETRVSRVYRDAKVLTIGGGTSEILRGVVARSIGL